MIGKEIIMGRKKVNIELSYPDVVGDVRVNLDFIWSRINKLGANDCWTWTGGKHRQGYPMCSGIRIADGKRIMMTVHRLMLKYKLGIDPGKNVDAVHTCGNSACVNPAHLVEGNAKMLSQLQLIRYGKIGGRPVGTVGYSPRNQKYKYKPDHLRQMLRNTLSPDMFSTIYGIPLSRANTIKRFMIEGKNYPWARRELRLEQESKEAGL